MKLASVKRIARLVISASALVLSVACETGAAAKPTLIPSLVGLKPAILCIEAALDRNGVLECLKSQGVTSDYRHPDQPSSTEDFTRQTLVMWASVGPGGTARLSSQHFDSAVDYATCIEKATNALQGLPGEPRRAIGAGRAKTELACTDQLLSIHSIVKRHHPDMVKGGSGTVPQGEAKAHLLAGIFAGAAYGYVIEANGWVDDKMRPCRRYLDGRPPSAGCAGEPELRAPPRPLTYSSN
jgi:hypothetical protein